MTLYLLRLALNIKDIDVFYQPSKNYSTRGETAHPTSSLVSGAFTEETTTQGVKENRGIVQSTHEISDSCLSIPQ